MLLFLFWRLNKETLFIYIVLLFLFWRLNKETLFIYIVLLFLFWCLNKETLFIYIVLLLLFWSLNKETLFIYIVLLFLFWCLNKETLFIYIVLLLLFWCLNKETLFIYIVLLLNLMFTFIMKALKCKPSAQLFAYNYTINVLSKCSNIISHRSSVFEGRHNDHRSSKVGTSIIHLRRSTHRSLIFESRHIDLRRSKAETLHWQPNIAPTFWQFVTEYCPQRHSIVIIYSRFRMVRIILDGTQAHICIIIYSYSPHVQ